MFYDVVFHSKPTLTFRGWGHQGPRNQYADIGNKQSQKPGSLLLVIDTAPGATYATF